MRAVLISTADPASVNIRDRLLEIGEWEDFGDFGGLPAYRSRSRGYVMLQQESPDIYAERIDMEISDFIGVMPELIIFASMHRSESGKKALTVHNVGNYGKADYGGKEHTLAVPCPRIMTEALRAIARNSTLPDYAVSYEVTHHGPYLETPSFFIEIGSTEEEWRNEEAGRVIARAIMDIERTEGNEDIVAIGIGGGHYAPRFTELALNYAISFGHMAPKYALDNLDRDILGQMVEKSGAEAVYFHKMGLKRSDISRLSGILQEMGVRRIKSVDIGVLEPQNSG